jgi:AraC family transcriptional activator FtrA
MSPPAYSDAFRDTGGSRPPGAASALRSRRQAHRPDPTPGGWSSDLPIEEVALRCGLGTAANLRVHLARELGVTPTGYRQAFRDATE